MKTKKETTSEPLYLGLDASTQSLKALAVDGNARPAAEYSVNFDRDLPQYETRGGVHHHDDELTVTAPPRMWVDALDLLFERMRADGFPFDRVLAISGSGQQHGSVYLGPGIARAMQAVDPSQPLASQCDGWFSVSESPIWMDSSTTAQCRALEQAMGGPQAVAEVTGSRAYERFTGNQIAKIYQTRPDRYQATERIALVSSFMAGLLAGGPVPIDYSDGSGMNLMDIRRRDWSPPALAACAPDLASRLGTPAPSHQDLGPVSAYWVTRCGFPDACRVIAFSGDNPNSLAGLRLQQDGDIAISLGTSDTVFGSLAEPRPSGEEGHVFVSPIDPDAYMALICFKNGSLTREWVRDRHARGDWMTFREAFERTPAGNNGRMALFYKEPEITPPMLRTGVFRFDAHDAPSDDFDPDGEIRAVVEAQFLSMRCHAERLGIRPRRLLATGGASGDPVMLRVMTDVFGVPVAVIDQKDSAALGAAYRALHGSRCHADGRFIPFGEALPVSATAHVAAEPDAAAHAMYTTMLERYARIEANVVTGQ